MGQLSCSISLAKCTFYSPKSFSISASRSVRFMRRPRVIYNIIWAKLSFMTCGFVQSVFACVRLSVCVSVCVSEPQNKHLRNAHSLSCLACYAKVVNAPHPNRLGIQKCQPKILFYVLAAAPKSCRSNKRDYLHITCSVHAKVLQRQKSFFSPSRTTPQKPKSLNGAAFETEMKLQMQQPARKLSFGGVGVIGRVDRVGGKRWSGIH